jgi:hypothetical protein
MSEDTENNIVNLSEYRERKEKEEAAKKEQEDFFNDDYPSIYPEGKTTHIKVDGGIFSIEDIITPEQSKDMVNTIMHLIRLIQKISLKITLKTQRRKNRKVVMPRQTMP